MPKLFTFKESYVKDNGIVVSKYEPTTEVYIDAIDPKTGNVRKKRITLFSVHENIKMYKISSEYFDSFYASEDHSLIIYDSKENYIKKISPKDIIEDNRNKYLIIEQHKIDNSLISELLELFSDLFISVKMHHENTDILMNFRKNNLILIPCEKIDISFDESKTVGYDFTVEDYYTFKLSSGLFVQDTMAVYFIDTYDGKKDIHEKKIHLKDNIINYQNMDYLHKLRHEMLYAVFILTSTEIDYDKEKIIINELKDLKITSSMFNDIDRPVYINSIGKTYSYGICMLNKVIFGNEIKITQEINKKNVTLINDHILNYAEHKTNNELERNIMYFDMFHELIKFLTAFLSFSKFNPSIDENDYKIYRDIQRDIRKLPPEPIIGDGIFKKLVDKTIDKMKQDNSTLYKIYRSGARASKDQIKQVTVARGYIANDYNIVLNEPIKSNLMEGLSEEELFLSSFGARKGLIDKKNFTPVSGYLERRMVMNSSHLTINNESRFCETERTLNFKVLSELHGKSLIGRFINLNNEIVEITKDNYKEFIGREIKLYSPIYCSEPNFRFCKLCTGNFDRDWRIGMLSAMMIAERFTQLTLRTFHVSAAASIQHTDEIMKLLDIQRLNWPYYNCTEDERKILNEELSKISNESYKVFIDENNKICVEGELKNQDIITTIEKINKLLTKKFTNLDTEYGFLTPEFVYSEIISEYLKHGFIKSLYIEVILSLLWYNPKEEKFLRYLDEINWNDITKISIPSAGMLSSPLITLLYEPNAKSVVLNIKNSHNTNIDVPYIDLIV